jgi:hypothetical protein
MNADKTREERGQITENSFISILYFGFISVHQRKSAANISSVSCFVLSGCDTNHRRAAPRRLDW